MGYTASFSPKPLLNINENGMHINLSISKEGKNLFYSQKDSTTSAFAKELAIKILFDAKELCLNFNSSTNSYRRLDPKFEVPNEIKMSALNRSAIIRLPLNIPKTTRIEIRSVAPDCNPYLAIFCLLKIGLLPSEKSKIFQTILNKRGNYLQIYKMH